MRRVIVPAVCAALSLVSSGCRTGSGDEAPKAAEGPLPAAAAWKTQENPVGIPELPPDYRRLFAEWALDAYMEDALGPPEISEAVSHQRLFGASTQVVVRFPVSPAKAHRQNMLIAADGPPRMRCMDALAFVSVSTLGRPEVKFRSTRIDLETCSPTLAYTRFHELEAMAARMRACPSKDKRVCLPVTPPPGGGTVVRYL